MSEGLIAKRDLARKSLERWVVTRQHTTTEDGQQVANDRIAFWTERVNELERLIRDASSHTATGAQLP